MAQSVKRSQQKYEESGLVLRTHRERSGVALHTFDPSAGEAVTGAALGPVGQSVPSNG